MKFKGYTLLLAIGVKIDELGNEESFKEVLKKRR